MARANALQGRPKLRTVGGPAPKSQEEREYFRSLHRLIDDIYTEALEQFDWTWSQLASNADLSHSTVQKLGERRTRFPLFRTVHKLAKAVGWEISLAKGVKGKAKGKQKLKVRKIA